MAKTTDKPGKVRSMKDLIKETVDGSKSKRKRKGNPDNDIEHDQGEVAPKLEAPADTSGRTPHTDIKKAKIKNELFLEVEYNELLKDGTNTVKKDCTAPVHDDLKKCFKKLDAYLASQSEQYTKDGEVDSARVTCRGFSISNDGEGVTLTGTRILENGKAFNFNSPYIKWDDEGAEKLRVTLNVCKAEVIKYLFEGKHQPEAQQKIDFSEDQNKGKENGEQ